MQRKAIILSVAAAVAITACADLNIEVQQTQRTNSEATRSPWNHDSDTQGSERVQGKSPTGMSVKNKVNNDSSKHVTTDVTGAEK